MHLNGPEEQPIFLSASSLVLGFLSFEPTLLGLLGKGDCFACVWGLIATSLMVPAVHCDEVTVQVFAT